MAKNGKPFRDDTWRERIKTSMLVNRLNQHAFGEIELSTTQLKSIEILLKKTIPDLKAVEHSGAVEQTVIQVMEYKAPDGDNNPTA